MWEIYAYQNADSLFGVFNAAAAIHGSRDYASAVAAVAFCGFVAALIAYAFAPEKLQGWKWLGSVVLVFGIAVAFWWSVKSGQFDDLEGPGFKVLMDDDEAAQGRIAESTPEKNKEKMLPVDPGQP